MRVLIVEDSGVLRAIITRALHSMGIRRIVETVDGCEAWKAFENKKFDLVVTDWHMPRISGIELVKLIREQAPDTPILMVTIADTRRMVVAALQAGVSDYLCKPFERDELVQKLDKYVHINQQTDKWECSTICD